MGGEKNVSTADQENVPVPGAMKENTIRKFFTYPRLLFAADPTFLDIALLTIGSLAAIASGVPFPIIGILFGKLIDTINSSTCSVSGTASNQYQHDVNHVVLQIVYIGIGYFAAAYICVFCWNLTGERLSQRLREQYFKNLLRQEAAFFDGMPAGEASSRVTEDIATIQKGTSERVSAVLNAISFFVTAYIVAFTRNATLAGELISLVPAYLTMTLVGGYYLQKNLDLVAANVTAASSVAMEALSNITVVKAFTANERLESKFAKLMHDAMIPGIKKSATVAIQAGLLYFIAHSGSALAFWQGSKFIAQSLEDENSGFSVGTTYTVIFILVDASIILSQVAPFIQIFAAASAAFERLEKDMTRQSRIDGTDEGSGIRLAEIQGNIDIKEVTFAYPSRPEQPALESVSLVFPAKKRTAIVGLSGSGKSTIAGLLLRLHDPREGSVLLDGHDIRALNVRFLRGTISIVQQGSILLNRSVLENIALGLVNSPSHCHLRATLLSPALSELAGKVRDGENLIQVAETVGTEALEIVQLVKEAATAADVMTFINNLPHGFGTIVGPGGTSVSGGQKQRISLARALVKDPKVLILDEATASLDSSSELRVQRAIDQATTGRTVIIIAHRLSTIKNADNIIVMRNARVVEQGTHTELLAKNQGEYADLVRLQQLTSIKTGSNGLNLSERPLSESLNKAKTKPIEVDNENTILDKPESSISVSGLGETDVFESDREYSALPAIWSLFRPYLLVLLIGLIGVAVVGGSYSAAAVIFGNTVEHLSPCLSAGEIVSSGRFYALMFFVLAIIEFFAQFISGLFFGWTAEKIQYRVRVLSFRSLLQQEQQWHECGGRTPSKLLSLITKDGNALGSLIGGTINAILAILINFASAVILSLVVAWKIALVCLAVLPLMVGAGVMRIRTLVKFEIRHAEAFSQSLSITVEAINSIEMIASYCLQEEILNTYRRSLQEPTKEVTLHSAYATLWLAVAYAMGNFLYALSYWWGAKQIIAGTYSQTQFFIVMMSLLVSAQLWSTMFTLAPDISQAHAGMGRIAKILNEGDQEPSNPRHYEGSVTDIESVDSHKSLSNTTRQGSQVVLSNIHFSYTGGSARQVLHGLNITIKPGQFAALVGPSGAGKSTIISLIERLYRPEAGAIEIDGRDITKTRGNDFRDNIAFVPQESVLFDGTIRFNVELGARPGHNATYAEIEEACRIANLHDTIMSMSQGYDTLIGPNGGQLSGGQKQRLAIARALVRKPQLLLLDESTSALDAESERLFQQGLDQITMLGNVTIIAIAHRLYTIQKADVIFLIDGGRCIDQGTHAELMERNESYRINANHQTVDH